MIRPGTSPVNPSSMPSAWSCLGLIATANESYFAIIDPTLPFCDPNYRAQLIGTGFRSDEHGLITHLQWNSVGSHLLLITQKNHVFIYTQTTGLSNQWKCSNTFRLRGEEQVVTALWCENRCKFSWNSSAMTTGKSSPSAGDLIVPRTFKVDFVPPGRLGVVLLMSNGMVEVLIESLESGKGFEHAVMPVPSVERIEKVSILGQRASGSVLIVSWTGSALVIHEMTSARDVVYLATLPSPPQPPSKIILQERKSELLVFSHQETSVNLVKYSLASLSIIAERSISLPFAAERIVHSPRAAGIFIASPKEAGQLALLSDSGELIKSIPFEAASELMLSPNGLCLGRVDWLGPFPRLSHHLVAELNPKNLNALREFVAKLITSTLNGSDSWDILHVIASAADKSSQSDAFSLLSTLLSEWAGYIEMASMRAEDFYGLLLELFKLLSGSNDDFLKAYRIIDASIEMLSVERSISAVQSNPESEEDLLSLIPILERAVKRLGHQLHSLPCNNAPTNSLVDLPLLMLLDAEFNRGCQTLLKMTLAVINKLDSLRESITSGSVNSFLNTSRSALLEALSPSISSVDNVCAFLAALLTDPHLQSKCSKNVFGFLTEVVLDESGGVAGKKLSGHIYRIYTRYFPQEANISGESSDSIPLTVDAIKGIKLPLNRCLPWILQCRRCSRLTLLPAQQRKGRLKSEQLFTADWQRALWKHRCQCGALRRKLT